MVVPNKYKPNFALTWTKQMQNRDTYLIFTNIYNELFLSRKSNCCEFKNAQLGFPHHNCI